MKTKRIFKLTYTPRIMDTYIYIKKCYGAEMTFDDHNLYVIARKADMVKIKNLLTLLL